MISQDPSIFSQVLKGANSPYFGCRGTVKDIARAIVIIGIKEVRNMCISLCLMQQFSVARVSPAFDSSVFWKHTLLVALLAQELAGEQGCLPREEAYTLGLLHDPGLFRKSEEKRCPVCLASVFSKVAFCIDSMANAICSPSSFPGFDEGRRVRYIVQMLMEQQGRLRRGFTQKVQNATSLRIPFRHRSQSVSAPSTPTPTQDR